MEAESEHSSLQKKFPYFVDSKCPVCLSEYTLSNPPYMICNEQHALCLTCYVKLSMSHKSFQCPKCRQIVIKNYPKVFRMHRDLLEFTTATVPFYYQVPKIQNTKPLAAKSPEVIRVQQEKRYFLSLLSGKAGFDIYSKFIEQGFKTEKPIIGLGNLEDIYYHLEFFPPYDALIMLGYDIEELSSYDLLSFFMMYDQDKQKHSQWYSKKLRDGFHEFEIKWGIANMYYNRMLYRQASQNYLKCLQIQPKNFTLIQRVALCLDKLNQQQSRDQYLKQLLQETRNSKFICRIDTKDLKSLDKAKKYVDECPKDCKRWIVLANHYVSREQKVECLRKGLQVVDSPHYAYYVESHYPSFEKNLMDPGVLLNLASTMAYCCQKLKYICCMEASKHPVVERLKRKKEFQRKIKRTHPQVIYDWGIYEFQRKNYQKLLDIWSSNESLVERFVFFRHFQDSPI